MRVRGAETRPLIVGQNKKSPFFVVYAVIPFDI